MVLAYIRFSLRTAALPDGRPAAEHPDEWLQAAQDALAALADRPGFVRGAIARSTDDETLYVLTSTWVDVGSFRRGLSATDVKLRAWPVLQYAVDEPSSFEVLHGFEGAEAFSGVSALAFDHGTIGLGSAAAPSVRPADGGGA